MLVYKINFKTFALGTLTNLMRSLATRLGDGYCSVTVANHQLPSLNYSRKVTLIGEKILQIDFIQYFMHARFSSRKARSRILKDSFHLVPYLVLHAWVAWISLSQ